MGDVALEQEFEDDSCNKQVGRVFLGSTVVGLGPFVLRMRHLILASALA